MRADNHGEGGILALMSMTGANWSKGRRTLIVMGLFGAGAALRRRHHHAGDLGIERPRRAQTSQPMCFKPAFSPRSRSAILFGLFAIQSRGTTQIAKASGPVMLLWFAVIAALGVAGISRYPAVIAAVDPRYGIALLTGHGWRGVAVLAGSFWR